jgi:hypothetical protein
MDATEIIFCIPLNANDSEASIFIITTSKIASNYSSNAFIGTEIIFGEP